MSVYASNPARRGRLTLAFEPGFDPAAINSATPTTKTMTSFVNRRQFMIQWGHCDPAGIVFNSRFFEFFDWNTWLMFEAALGVPPSELEGVYGIMGLPLVDAKARFIKPARFNDVVQIASQVSEFRRSSFDVAHRLYVDGELA